MRTTIVDHPLVAVLLARVRRAETGQAEFAAAVEGLGAMLVYEASRSLATDEVPVRTPLADTVGARLAAEPFLVPIPQAGLGLLGPAQRLLPGSATGGSLAFSLDVLASRRPGPGHRRLHPGLSRGRGPHRRHRAGRGAGGGRRRRAPGRPGLHRPWPGRRRRPPVRHHVSDRRRAGGAARQLGRVAVAWADVLRHGRDPKLRRWGPVLAGARHGHFTLPSFAVLSSVTEAADFEARGLLPPDAAVLDVGAGNGRQAIGLLQLGVGRYVGLEVVRECVDFGNRAFRRHGNVRFDWVDAANEMYNPAGALDPSSVVFPYGDGEFDLVVAGSLFTHLQSADVAGRYIGEMARVLKPGGAAFTTWFRSPPNELAAGALRSVFAEEVIRDLVSARFDVEAATGGDTTSRNDQWRLYLRRREEAATPPPPGGR